MIGSFGNKLAFNLFTYGEAKKIDSRQAKRAKHLLDIVDAVDAVDNLEDLKTLGFPPRIRLHMLKGSRKGAWAIDVVKTTGLRITFKLQGNFEEVKIEDYHK